MQAMPKPNITLLCLYGRQGKRKKNGKKGEEWLYRAALQNQTKAQDYLSVLYVQRLLDKKNRPGEIEQARQWLENAARRNDKNAIYMLNVIEQYSRKTSKNQAETLDTLRRRAEQGNADSQFMLGEALLAGTGMKKNPEEAVRWFEKAGKTGQH